ncbi:hypothetical protein CR513_24671, partial [Mucuna pruriens]
MTICIRHQSRTTLCQYLGWDEVEVDAKPWYHDIKGYLKKGAYPERVKEIIEEVHEGTFGTHINGHALAQKILREQGTIGPRWSRIAIST